jgi:glyoxylase-like metal-dependent hydrolase (beta-lactamase superfamily II)
MTGAAASALALLAAAAVAAATCAATAEAQSRRSAERSPSAPVQGVRALQVRPNIYMVTGGGANVTVQIGKHGILLVDAPLRSRASEVATAISALTPSPIRYLINTSGTREHIEGNDAIAALGSTAAAGPSRTNAAPSVVLLGSAQGMTILAHQNVLNRLARTIDTDDQVTRGMLPTSTYFEPTKDFSFNGEPIVVYHMPNAHSDGDSIVFFRSSDVISAGDVFTPDRYPAIDRARGGSVQGVLAALNTILAMTVPEAFAEGGTKVIPGHGRLCEETDVAEYRDMVYIVTERIRDLIAKGHSLAEVQAARPTRDYDLEYPSPAVTPAMFVEAAYASLAAERLADED